MEVVQLKHNNFIKFLNDIVSAQHKEHVIKLSSIGLPEFLSYIRSCGSLPAIVQSVEDKYNIPIRSYHENDVKKCERYIEYFFSASHLI